MTDLNHRDATLWRMRSLVPALIAGSSAFAVPAAACTIAPLPPMTAEQQAEFEKQREQEFVELVRSADAVVEVEALTTSGPNLSQARFKILRVLSGDAKVGSRLKLRTVGGSLCGAGGVKRGEKGIIYISSEDKYLFTGFLSENSLELLAAAGIIPASR